LDEPCSSTEKSNAQIKPVFKFPLRYGFLRALRQAYANMSTQELQAVVAQLSARLGELENRPSKSLERTDLDDGIKDAIAPHLQLAPLLESDRKSLLRDREYARFDGIPKPIKDTNSLAGRALGNSPLKNVLLNTLPSFQADALDLAHLGASVWQRLSRGDLDGPAQLAICQKFIKDVVMLSMDNTQRIARFQLKKTFEVGGAKGAYDLMDLAPGSMDLDERNPSLFQQAHIEALQQLKRFNGSIDASKPKKDQPANFRRNGGGGNFQRNGRGYGGRGRGRGGGRGGYSGRGNSQWRDNKSRGSGNEPKMEDE
jgi:hypothetical protein